ncbi:MAG: DMT family transporter [Bacteroidales bacterium]|nr:DMT family transporter [Bacteroidales bacterium]MCM1206074.1 DMT family transporter [Bacillota bacterium]
MPLYSEGITPGNVLFYRYAISTILMGIYMIVKGKSFRLTKNEALATMAMGCLFAGSSAGLFCSFKYMNPGLASVILFTYPLFVALLSWLFFHEQMSYSTLLCIIVALFGISLLDQSSINGNISMTGMILAIISGLTYAIYLIGVNRSILKDMSISRLSFFALAFGTVIFFISNGFGAGVQPLHSITSWGNAVGLAIFPTVISLLLITRSIHIIGSTPASIIGALEPVTALAVSVSVFGGVLTGMNIIGILIILGAVLFMVYGNNTNK